MVSRVKEQKPEGAQTYLGEVQEVDCYMGPHSKNKACIPISKASRHLPKVGAV